MEKGELSLNSGKKDQRRHDREPLALPVRFKILNRKLALELLEPGVPEQDGRTVNLGLGGLCLSTPSPLNKGDYLKVEMTLPGADHPIRAMAEVVWTGTVERSFRAGVRFLIVLKEADEDPIKAYLERREAK